MITCAFCDIWSLVVSSSSQIALACSSSNFENLLNITHAHLSRNALTFRQLSILIILLKVGLINLFQNVFLQLG